MGRVHLGMLVLLEVLAEYSGAYLPGPTDAGVDVSFLSPPPPLR